METEKRMQGRYTTLVRHRDASLDRTESFEPDCGVSRVCILYLVLIEICMFCCGSPRRHQCIVGQEWFSDNNARILIKPRDSTTSLPPELTHGLYSTRWDRPHQGFHAIP